MENLSEIENHVEFILEILSNINVYVKEQKAIIQKDYPDEIHGYLVLNYLDCVLLKHVKYSVAHPSQDNNSNGE